MSAWDKCIEFMEPLEVCMPDSGKANTVGGEMTRAVERIVYRFFNDGDNVGSWKLYDSYGNDLPSVTYAAAYLIDEYRSFGSLGNNLKNIVEHLVYDDLSDSKYERTLVELCKVARSIFDKFPEIFQKRNADDMFTHTFTAEEIKNTVWEPEPEDEDEDEDW